jgi:hypothetical protein
MTALNKLDEHEGDVQPDPDREGLAEIGGRVGMTVFVPAPVTGGVIRVSGHLDIRSHLSPQTGRPTYAARLTPLATGGARGFELGGRKKSHFA